MQFNYVACQHNYDACQNNYILCISIYLYCMLACWHNYFACSGQKYATMISVAESPTLLTVVMTPLQHSCFSSGGVLLIPELLYSKVWVSRNLRGWDIRVHESRPLTATNAPLHFYSDTKYIHKDTSCSIDKTSEQILSTILWVFRVLSIILVVCTTSLWWIFYLLQYLSV